MDLVLARVGVRPGRGRDWSWQERMANLEAWHELLRDRLAHGEYEDRLDALARHPALAGKGADRT